MTWLINTAWLLFCKLPLRGRHWSLVIRIVSQLIGKGIKVSYDCASGLYRISENDEGIFVARRSRIRLFHRGLTGRIKFVEESYSVPRESVNPGGTVIDCGANIGEFSRAMESKGAICHAFEPDPREFQALERNLTNPKSTPHNVALRSKTGVALLHQANDSGDSSVTEIRAESLDALEIETTTLDSFAEQHLEPGLIVSLIKLEAEGGEIEVLKGGTHTLLRTMYVCADLGEATGSAPNAVPEVVNLLLRSGFEIVDFRKQRCMTVFWNARLAASQH
mgnify:CR=1 FL=1